MDIAGPLGITIALLGASAAILVVLFVMVPLFKGVGFLIGKVFQGIGWLVAHIFDFVFGILGDVVRLIGSIPVFLVFALMTVLNVAIGRWSAAGHFARGAQREVNIAGTCIYRTLLQRPLKLVMLNGLLEGVEQRLPQGMGESPGRDTPPRQLGKFDGYKITGSLRGGGSGGKLYIAQPLPEKKAALPHIPDRVVIKSFALADGSSLPQIVRESRALECAKQLGHVIEHGMTESRFHYVMPYIPGDHMGVVARDLHARSGGKGLREKDLHKAVAYAADLVATLAGYHQGGFWHKDVKPENIIVHDGRAHLVDLGLVTSLRSPMTLTTHGTEYFRDPEMVRQALRGVKVHDVDGSKFDIFAAGAVLYFLLENTFPAHGVLSRFNQKSPESLRWVVRRAMAEYDKRYPNAETMLADLQFIAASADPFAVRPVDLPSMSGADMSSLHIDAPDPLSVHFAGSPVPPAMNPGSAVPAAAVASFDPDAHRSGDSGKPRPERGALRRPLLRVTNWFTGEYEVEDPGSARDAFQDMGERFSERTRDVADGLAWQPAAVPKAMAAARQRAHEQVASARARARAKADASRLRARSLGANAIGSIDRSENKSHPVLAVLGILVLGCIVGGVFIARNHRGSDFSRQVAHRPLPIVDGPAIAAVLVDATMQDEDADRYVGKLAREYADSGYRVFPASVELQAALKPIVTRWWEQSGTGEIDDQLEAVMEEYDLYGIIEVTRQGHNNFNERMCYSTAENAKSRKGPPHDAVLVINDAFTGSETRLNIAIQEHFGSNVQQINVDDEQLAQTLRDAVNRAEAGDVTRTNTFERNAVDRLIAEHGAVGLIWIQQDDSKSSKYTTHVITPDFADTALAAFQPPLPANRDGEAGRYVIVNDHPALRDPVVSGVQASLRAAYETAGHTIVDDVEATAAVTVAWNRYRMSPDQTTALILTQILKEFESDGVVVISRGAHDAGPKHVEVTLIDEQAIQSRSLGEAVTARD
ncbi:MAG: serine/threonine protein kinase [Phycisphaerales bacterium]